MRRAVMGVRSRITMRRISPRVAVVLAALLVVLAGAAVSGSVAGACAGPCNPADYDGDKFKDWADNCPLARNPSQLDTDSDTPAPLVNLGMPPEPVGSVTGAVIVYPSTPYQSGQVLPTDQNPEVGGDACDVDDDADGIWDRRHGGKAADNCRLVPNPDQKDSDNDGLGDACSDPRPVEVAKIQLSAPRSLHLDEIGAGIPVTVSCSARCNVSGELMLDSRSASRIHLSRTAGAFVVGRGGAYLEAKGSTFLFVKVPAKSIKRLRKAFRRLRPMLKIAAPSGVLLKRRITLLR